MPSTSTIELTVLGLSVQSRQRSTIKRQELLDAHLLPLPSNERHTEKDACSLGGLLTGNRSPCRRTDENCYIQSRVRGRKSGPVLPEAASDNQGPSFLVRIPSLSRTSHDGKRLYCLSEYHLIYTCFLVRMGSPNVDL